MKKRKLAAVVMAAGLGKRMQSATPKHFHSLLGRRMVDWVLESTWALSPERLVVVAGPAWSDAFTEVEVAVQQTPRGTGDAVASARALLADFDGDILIVPGDAPLVSTETLRGLVEGHRARAVDGTVLSFAPAEPLPYGRIVRDEAGELRRIVEAVDASAEELEIRELNASLYVFAAEGLWSALERLDAANAQGELYLTDTIEHLLADGRTVAVHPAQAPEELQGVNNRVELAQAAARLRDRINRAHMLAGVTLVDPVSTWIEPEVVIEPDAVIHPFTVLRGRTRIASGVEIRPFVEVVDTAIGPDTSVGPFCYLRPGTVLGAGSKAGTFVEIKNTSVGDGAKLPHLSYVGDAEIGEGTNLGAGNITANFAHQPGQPKKRTTIGRNVRTAIHNGFIAPVTIGDDAWTAAGSIITDDVPPGALAGFAPRQVTRRGYVYGKRDD